jgi:peptide/nickel transport system substrate-binding protein
MAAEARTAAHGYSNPEVDRLLNDASKTKDQEKRLEYFNQVQEIFQEELPFITVAYFFILFRTHINLSFASSAQFSVSR